MTAQSAMTHPHWCGVAPRVVLVVLALVAVAGCGGDAPTPPPATPAGSVAPQELRIVARNIAFEPATLAATAGIPIQLTLDNQDAGIPHNVAVRSGSVDVTKSAIVTGPATVSVDIDPPPVGVLQVACEVHPNMTASITVSAP